MKTGSAIPGEEMTVAAGVTSRRIWTRQALQAGTVTESSEDFLAEEVPVALVYNGISHVVMMATPQHLEAFALGFSLSEGIISQASEIYGIEVQPLCAGVEVHIELSARRFMALKAQRRAMAGRTGCGVCGVEQLQQIGKPVPPLPFSWRFNLSALDKGLSQLADFQPAGRQTGCTHVAAWMDDTGQLLQGYEDVGRHVALDKLLGDRARQPRQQGAVVVSSRASYEMVQKAAICGVEILFAVSAATALAVDVAERCGMTLAGFSKPGRTIVYSHPRRLY